MVTSKKRKIPYSLRLIPYSFYIRPVATTQETIEVVKKIFSAHLEQRDLRKTAERFAILEEIYSRTDHFEAEQLYIDLLKKEVNVSRATVYNTLDLLLTCELIRKHQFGRNQAQYEKSYGYKQHDHIICIECKKVVEFCDPRLQQIQNMAGDLLNFQISHHTLQFYGTCSSCQMKQKANV